MPSPPTSAAPSSPEASPKAHAAAAGLAPTGAPQGCRRVPSETTQPQPTVSREPRRAPLSPLPVADPNDDNHIGLHERLRQTAPSRMRSGSAAAAAAAPRDPPPATGATLNILDAAVVGAPPPARAAEEGAGDENADAATAPNRPAETAAVGSAGASRAADEQATLARAEAAIATAAAKAAEGHLASTVGATPLPPFDRVDHPRAIARDDDGADPSALRADTPHAPERTDGDGSENGSMGGSSGSAGALSVAIPVVTPVGIVPVAARVDLVTPCDVAVEAPGETPATERPERAEEGPGSNPGGGGELRDRGEEGAGGDVRVGGDALSAEEVQNLSTMIGADALRRSGTVGAAAMTASRLFASFPPVWVTRWVDYTSKYGLGYVLSDGTFGVMFNDATKMVQSPDFDPAADDGGGGRLDPGREGAGNSGASHAGPSRGGSSGHSGSHGRGGDRLEYRERTRRSGKTPSPPPLVFAASGATPEGLEKKVKLMRHFRGYLSQDGRSAVERSAGGLGPTPGAGGRHPSAAAATAAAAAEAERSGDAARSPYLPHVKNWLRTKHATLFRLSNRTIQVNFQDGSEVLLSSEAAATVFTSKTGRRGVYVLSDLPSDPELLRRLRYVKEVLHQLVHRA